MEHTGLSDEGYYMMLLSFLHDLKVVEEATCSDLMDSIEEQDRFNKRMWADLQADRFR